MAHPELQLVEQPRMSRGQARDSLEAVYWQNWPDLGDMELARPEPGRTDREQMLHLLTQSAIDEGQIPQKLSHVVYNFGQQMDELGTKRISSPDFHLTLLPKRLEDSSLAAVPSLLHSQFRGYFGTSIPLFPDYSLDTTREMVFSWHGERSIRNAAIILPIIAARTAYLLGMPLQPHSDRPGSPD